MYNYVTTAAVICIYFKICLESSRKATYYLSVSFKSNCGSEQYSSVVPNS